ncbi:MAG: dihydroorotase [Lachnospiraceae bacterium]|nr:dihydroorotase [Lachnospiraceae bacterium]
MNIIIKHGHICDPGQELDTVKDIYVEDGIISEISDCIEREADRVIDAAGLLVMPGFIDMHVHLREPGFEYKETIKTGSQAAAAGGFTSICPMPNTKPVIDSPEMIKLVLETAGKDAIVNILPIGAMTIGQEGKTVADIKGMASAGAIAVSEDGKSVMDSLTCLNAMKKAAEAGIPVFDHCEDKTLVNGGVINAGPKAEELGLKGIMNEVEDTITARDIMLAHAAGAHLHLCHVSTAGSTAIIGFAKQKGLDVTAEVTPHHFALCDADIPADDADYKMNPPLRSAADCEAVTEGLKCGTIDVIATDHAPHSAEEKQVSMSKAPFGITGLETAYGLAVTELVEKGIMTHYELARRMSLRPAEILGIEKGTLKPGYAADIVITDPEKEWIVDRKSFLSKGKNTPFDGKKLKGRVVITIVGGRIVYENGQVIE